MMVKGHMKCIICVTVCVCVHVCVHMCVGVYLCV